MFKMTEDVFLKSKVRSASNNYSENIEKTLANAYNNPNKADFSKIYSLLGGIYRPDAHIVLNKIDWKKALNPTNDYIYMGSFLPRENQVSYAVSLIFQDFYKSIINADKHIDQHYKEGSEERKEFIEHCKKIGKEKKFKLPNYLTNSIGAK